MGFKGGWWFNASSQPCNVLQNPFSHFFYCEILVWKKIVFVEFVISLLDVNFLLIMMSNVTCLCTKLQIWDMGFCHCWISLRNIVKDLQKTQVEYCWITKLAFWCYFSFPSTWSIVSVSETFRSNAHCVDAWISREDKYLNRREATYLMVWKSKKKKEARRESYKGNGERIKIQRKRKRKKAEEECYIIWKRIAWHDFIGWRKSSVLHQLRTEFNLFNKRGKLYLAKVIL